jgi:DNA polymerase III subunit delta
MIIKSYEIKKNISSFLKYNLFLLYGENFGLKKDIKNFIKSKIKEKDKNAEVLSLYENEVIDNDENFYNFIYSGSLFGNKKIIIVYDTTDKIIEKINDVNEKYPENTFLIFFSQVLEKKSKLRNFFEKEKKTICIPCYLDNERDLQHIAELEFKKENIKIARESINMLVEKSNSDRNNLKNEIEKIKAYSLNKRNIDINEVKSLINFAGDYKSDFLINECLNGNIMQYKKIISEQYLSAINQILLLRMLSNKVYCLLKIKEQENSSNNVDNLINTFKPPIFWKDKPIVKKQLSIWKLDDLKEMIGNINNIELLCKKNPQISNSIFFNFFSDICVKANNFV